MASKTEMKSYYRMLSKDESLTVSNFLSFNFSKIPDNYDLCSHSFDNLGVTPRPGSKMMSSTSCVEKLIHFFSERDRMEFKILNTGVSRKVEEI